MLMILMEWSRNMAILVLVVIHRVVVVLAVVVVTVCLLVEGILHGESFQLVGACTNGGDV